MDSALKYGFRFWLVVLHLTTAASLVGASAHAADPARSERKPNILFIVADDLGFADVGFHGGKEIPTPHIDSIARGGVRFQNGYVSGPYCSPTRAGLLTGRYQQRFGHEFNAPGPNFTNNAVEPGLPLKETTLAQRLKSVGYRTGVIGKWHLGFPEAYRPQRRGFDEFFGFLGAAHSFTNAGFDTPNSIRRGDTPVDETEFLTTAFTREAVSFIERNRQQPFFLYVAYNAVHSPLDVDPKYAERFQHIADPKRRAFAGLLAGLDDGVGRILRSLRENDLERETLVVFFSDNGGIPSDNTSRNEPLRGAKFETWDGGVHVPFAIQWKGRLAAGKVYEHPIIQLDLHATALGLAGIAVQPEWKLDGVNLLPFLLGERREAPHTALYWRFGDQFAIRKGDWKLVKGTVVETPQLFDLGRDPGEQKNLAEAQPEKLAELDADWRRWNTELVPPLWPRGGGPRPGNARATAPR